MSAHRADPPDDAPAVSPGAEPDDAARLCGLRVFTPDGGCCGLGGALSPGTVDVTWTSNPRQADVLLVAGSVNAKAAGDLRAAYDAMPHPRKVVSIGACALDGGPFRRYPNVLGGADAVVPVDLHIPGCPPAPEAVRAGLARVADGLRNEGREGGASGRG